MSSGEKSLWRLKKRIKDFDCVVNREGLHVSFLTVTQSDKSIGEGYRWISQVMRMMSQKIKRSGHVFYYVAVLEIQPKRYRERGVLAPHWHIAIATDLNGAFPHSSRVKRLKREREGLLITFDWLIENVKQKFGVFFICDCWSSRVYDYLGKYISKGSELQAFKEKLGKRVRVFSASRFPVKYQMSIYQSNQHAGILQSSPESEELYWRREDSKIVGRAKEIVTSTFLNMTFTKVRYPKVYVIKGDWQLQEYQPAQTVESSDGSNQT
jgi:hypothetical protein